MNQDETPALRALRQMLDDVDSLIAHHPKATDPRRGKPAGPGHGPLLRACVALIYTAWEVYVEESLIWTVEQLVDCEDPTELPESLTTWVTSQGADPWDFAGAGWRQLTLNLVTEHVRGDEKSNHGLNTASPRNVTQLHKEVLGAAPLNVIRWQKKSNKNVRDDVALLVSIRGSIVHRGETPGALSLAGVRSWRDFVLRLCERLDAKMTALAAPL